MLSRLASFVHVVLVTACLGWALGAAVDSAPARAADTCAPTLANPGPSTPAPDASCWTEVQPYPFGADGDAVDTTSPECSPNSAGDPLACYLQVDSLAFRAWNRGLASTSRAGASATPTAFGVWLFNGARWYPDATFPGQSVCVGDKILWAGKLDYWLIGSRDPNAVWPRLCRFDGVNFTWQPLDVPQATRERVPDINSPSGFKPGRITSASCLTWDNCWFFGSYGAVAHWDGIALSDASPAIVGDRAKPWLGTHYTAALAGTNAAGVPFGLAVGTSGGSGSGEQLASQPDGTPPPQLFGSTGSAFSPLSLSLPTAAQPDDPFRTDLVAVDADSQGYGWVAGNPVFYRTQFLAGLEGSPPPGRAVTTAEPAPLVPMSTAGAPVGCSGPSGDRFMYANAPNGENAFLWSSLSVFRDSGDALAGGQMRPATAGGTLNDDGIREPVLVEVACDGTVEETRFRVGDPTATPDPSGGPYVPANRGGAITAVAANATNDAWAASTRGALRIPGDATTFVTQRPRLYRFSDSLRPTAPDGDDDESRPLVFEPDPPIFVEAPPEAEPPPAPDTTATTAAPPRTRRVKLKPAIYAISTKVSRGPDGTVTLYVRFKVRRPVTIGVQALRGRKVVSRSGLKRFRGTRGKLALRLDPRRWPTRIRFVTNKARPRAVRAAPPSADARP